MKKTLLKSAAITASVFALGLAAVACGPEADSNNPDGKDKVYAVTYDLNGGTGTLPTETDKKAGAKFNLAKSDGLSNGVKELEGWSDGTNTYKAGAEYTMPAHAVTFTAQWGNGETPIVKYKVTYKHGAAGDDVVKNDQTADNYKLEDPTVNEDDGDGEYYKLFAGWTVEGDSAVYLPGASYTLTKDTTFTAQWVDFDDDYSWRDTTDTLQLLLLTDKVGAFVKLTHDDNYEWTYFTYTVSGTAITLNPVSGNSATGTYDKTEGELTVSVKVGMSTYKFQPQGQEQPPATGLPTFTFQLNGGTGTVPTVTATEDMLNSSSGTYLVPMPANTITPPAGKAFKRWVVSDGKGEWPTNAGSKFSADKGVQYTVKPEWKDAAPEAPTGTVFNGDWNTPAGTGGVSAVASVNVKKVWLDLNKNALFYKKADAEYATKATLTAESDELPAAVKTAYGADASLYSVKIETLGYYLIVTADKTKLAFAKLDDADMTVLQDSEFTRAATYTVTYNKPNGATGVMAAVETAEGEYLLSDCSYEKEGWTFLGWLDESLGEYDDPVLVGAGDEITVSDNVSYVAVFAKTYTNSKDSAVKLDLRDDGRVLLNLDDQDVYCYWGAVSENLVMLTDYWYYTAYAKLSGSTYTEGDQMLAYSFTTKDGNTTLTFDGNGKALLGTHEGTYTLLEDDYYGYVIGVNLTFDGKTYACEFDYDVNDEYYETPLIYADIAVGEANYLFDPYSSWYTITFEVDESAQNAPESPVKIHNSIGGNLQAKVEFPKSSPTKTEYYFVGWAVKDSDGAVGNTVSTYNYKVTADTTFVAVWVKKSFAVTYSAGDVGSDTVTGFEEGGSASVNSVTLQGRIAKLRDRDAVTRDGYILDYWVIQGDDSGTPYQPGTSNVYITGDTTFVAVWVEAVPHTVTYDLNGGTGTLPTETDKLQYATFTLAAATGLTNGEKVFDGWSDGTKKYKAGDEYTMPNANVTFTAQWKDLSAVELTGTKTYAGTYNGKAASIVINFDTNDITFKYIVTGQETVYTYNNVTKSDAGYFVQSSNNPTGSAVWVVVSANGQTVKLYDNYSNAPDEQQGGDYTLQHKIAEFVGDSSTNPIKYGYSSATDAGSNVFTVGSTDYYYVELYYDSDMANAILKNSSATGKTCRIRLLNTSTNVTPDDDLDTDDVTFTIWGVGITSGGTISFSVENGVRKVTISKDTLTVTWTEITD